MCLLGPRGIPALIELSSLVHHVAAANLLELKRKLAVLYIDGHCFRGRCMLLPEAYTLLHVAVQDYTISRDMRYAISALLLRFGFCPNARDRSGCSPFWYAMHWNEPDLVKLFLEFGADHRTSNLRSWDCLARGVSQGAIESVRILLQHRPNLSGLIQARPVPELMRCGASIPTISYPRRPQVKVDVNQFIADNSKRTVLTLAVLNGACKIVELLLEHGASPNLFDVYGRTAIHHAVRSHAPDEDARSVLKALLKKSVNVDFHSPEGLPPWQYTITKASAIHWMQLFAYAGSEFDLVGIEGVNGHIHQQALVYAKTMRGRSVVERIALHRDLASMLKLIPKLTLREKFGLEKQVCLKLPVIDGMVAFQQPVLSKELMRAVKKCRSPYGPLTLHFHEKFWPGTTINKKSVVRSLMQCTRQWGNEGRVFLPPELLVTIISFF